MSDEFEAPPIGGEAPPLKEQVPENPKPLDKTGLPKKQNKLFLWLLIALLFLVIGLTVGLILGPMGFKKTIPQVSPSPSLDLVTAPSPYSQNQINDLKTMQENLENHLKELNLQESSLNPPNIDYNIRFKIDKTE